MGFPRALLLSALLGSAALTRAAPIASTCSPNLEVWGSITFEGIPLSLGADGSIEVGGPALNFAVASCQTEQVDRYDSQSKGYLVNANDPSQCLAASHLGDSPGTFSFQGCGSNGVGGVSSLASFAWDTGIANAANAYFNGENNNYVNSSQPPIYSFNTEFDHYTFDGSRGKLTFQHTPPGLTSLPTALEIPANQLPVTATPVSPPLVCGTYQTGQINFNNQTSSSNQYNGPVNAKWEAQADATTSFVFEQCDYSPAGIKDTDEVVYGRIRPATDLQRSTFQCYDLTSTDYDWVNGIELSRCDWSTDNVADNPKAQIVVPRLNKKDSTIEWVTFENGAQTAVGYAYTQLDFDEEFSVTQYVWDGKGVGIAFVDPNNPNLAKYPPGKITLVADS